MASRSPTRRRGGITRPHGHLADYERFKAAYDKLLLEEPENLIALTLVQMDLDRSRLRMLGLPVPERMRFDFEAMQEP